MSNLDYQAAQPEKRREAREPEQMFVTIRPLNDEVEDLSLTVDKSTTGAGIVTHIPLPVGARLEIRRGDDFVAIAEVADWNWDAQTDLVRLGLRLVAKKGDWPQE